MARVGHDQFPPAVNDPAMLQAAGGGVDVGDVVGVLLAEDAGAARDGPGVGQVDAGQALGQRRLQQRRQRRPEVDIAGEVVLVQARLQFAGP